MASHLNPPLRYRTDSLLSKPMQFQRGKGKIKTKKNQRKIKLRLKHILLSLLLIGGIFYSLQKVYLFLISWDNLNVKEIDIVCHRSEVKKDIYELLKGKNLGNILLLDIRHIREILTDFTWIKEVRIRKIFPSSLKIEVQIRKPAALLKRENIYLIDTNGILLEKADPKQKILLPLLVDANNFEKDYREKLELAWECLRSLSSSQKEQIDILDLTEYENIITQLKGKKEKIILGNNDFSQKLELFKEFMTKLEKTEPIEYVDLRFPNRIIYRPLKNTDKNPASIPTKEVN